MALATGTFIQTIRRAAAIRRAFAVLSKRNPLRRPPARPVKHNSAPPTKRPPAPPTKRPPAPPTKRPPAPPTKRPQPPPTKRPPAPPTKRPPGRRASKAKADWPVASNKPFPADSRGAPFPPGPILPRDIPTAILIGGRIVTQKLDEYVQEFLRLKAELSPGNVVFFISLNEAVDDVAYRQKFCERTNTPMECVQVLRTKTPVNAYDGIKCSQRWWKNFIWRSDRTWSMFFHTHQAFCLMRRYEEAHRMTFRRVIKYRGDILANKPQSLFFPTEEGVLYVPDKPDYGGLSDQIAVGDRKVMDAYCNLINRLPEVKERLKRVKDLVELNQERFLGLYVKDVARLHVRRFPYEYALEPSRHDFEKRPAGA